MHILSRVDTIAVCHLQTTTCSFHIGTGGLGSIKVKLEPNIEDAVSNTSAFPDSIAGHSPSHSKAKSTSPRKTRRVHKTFQVRKKPDSLRKASSSESTDELEDFEPPANRDHAKQKRLSVRQDIPSKCARRKSPSRRFRQESPSNVKVLFSDDDTTDDMDECTKPIVISDDDNVFENANKPHLKSSKNSSPASIQHQSQSPHGQTVQQATLADTPVKKTLKLSLNRCRSSPKRNPVKVLTQTQRISTLSILLEQSNRNLPQQSSIDTISMKKASNPTKGDSMDGHTPSRRLSTEVLLSPAEETPMPAASSNTLAQSLATSNKQHSPSAAIVDLSTAELKEFEEFSDTETGDDVSTLKQKRKVHVRGRFPSSTDADTESVSEAKGCYRSPSKKENSIKKVRKWLDSSGEGNILTEDAVAQPDSQTGDMMQASTMEQTTSNPPSSKLICDTSDQQSKLAAQSERVSSSLELRGIEAVQFKGSSQSDRDKYTAESSSSTSSSLPPVMWEEQVGSLVEERDVMKVSYNQLQSVLQSALITTSSNKQTSASTSAVDVNCERGHSDVSLLEDRDMTDEGHSKVAGNQVDEQDTPEEVQRAENNLREQSMKGITAIRKEIVDDTKEDSEPESMSIGSPMEVDMYQSELPVTEDHSTFDQAVRKGEASHDMTVSKQCRHSSSEIYNSSVAKSGMPIRSKTNKQVLASASPVRQTTKSVAIVERAKPSNRKKPEKILPTKVLGMTYSSRKAILERNDLPDRSVSVQGPPAKTPLSGISSLKRSDVNQTERLLLTQSLSERHVRMQSSNASVAIKKPLPTASVTSAACRAPVEYKGITSQSRKKIQPSFASPNTNCSSALSFSTQNLLDSIGQPSSIANVSNESRPKHPPSFIPAKISKKHVPLKPKILPKVDDFSREVLSWDPAGFLYPLQAENGKLVEPTIQLKEELVKVPSIEPFESFNHYLSTFKPLIFHELWSTVSSCM